MKPAVVILLLLLSMWLVLGFVANDDAPRADASGGKKHANIKTMDHVPSGPKRHEGLLLSGWLFGGLQIAVFVACLALGFQRRGRLGKWVWAILAAGLVYLGVFSMMILAYGEFMREGGGEFSGPFPVPTAWMLFGLWAAPLLFVGIYIFAFDRWIFTEEDQRRFEQLVAARRAERETTSSEETLD